MTLSHRANEIATLVHRLGSSRANDVESATARLAVIGPPAVESLLEALDATDPAVRERATALLARIGDARAREPLTAALHDRDPRVRARAAVALVPLRSTDTAAHLERVARRDEDIDVRRAAVHALVRLYAAGDESGLTPALEFLLDVDEATEIRRAAAGILPELGKRQRSAIHRRLEGDPDGELARIVSDGPAPRSEADPGQRLAGWIETLRSGGAGESSWPVVAEALASRGATAVAPLIDAMHRDPAPEFCRRVGRVLEAIGPKRGRAVVEALDWVRDPTALRTLVDVLGAYGVKAWIYRLRDLVEAIEARERDADPETRSALRRVRARAHLKLAEIGSRVAVENLRQLLATAESRVEVDGIASLARIGTRRELVDVLRAARRAGADDAAVYARAVREIVRRERIHRDGTFVAGLGGDLRDTLSTLLPG